MIHKKADKSFFTTESIQKKIIVELQNIKGIKWQIQQYNYLYLIHKIIYHYTIRKDDTEGCPINIKYTAKLFSKPCQQTSRIVNNLLKWGIIEITKRHEEKVNSTLFKLADKYNSDKILVIYVHINDVGFIKKLIKKEELSTEDEICIQSINIFNNYISLNDYGYLYINKKYFNSSLSAIHGYSKMEYRITDRISTFYPIKETIKSQGGLVIERRDLPLFLIANRDFYCGRPLDKNGNKSRVYNNLTNLPSDHRVFINFDNSALRMTDISNSQILLSVPAIVNYFKIYSGKGKAGIPEDVLRFKSMAEKGTFYEDLASYLTPQEIAPEARKLLKSHVFKQLWFGTVNRFFPRVKQMFKKHFPNVFKAINELKKEDYKQFSIKMQAFEAKIMIDQVVTKMLAKGKKVLTLHDAIITTNLNDLAEAEKRITKALKKYNITPQFKREERTEVDMSIYFPETADAASSTGDKFRSKNRKILYPLKKRDYSNNIQ